MDLLDGVSFIPAMIGMFALSQVLRTVTTDLQSETVITKIGSLSRYMGATVRRFWLNILRSSLLGNVLGALPGAGADIAAWIAYSLSKRFSKTPEKFGKGYEEGIADAGSANNSAVAGAWTPALVFGIPGDSVTAIAIGVLMLKGITPSPRVFQTDGDLVYAIFFAFIIANLILLPLGIIAIRACPLRHVLTIPEARADAVDPDLLHHRLLCGRQHHLFHRCGSCWCSASSPILMEEQRHSRSRRRSSESSSARSSRRTS